MGQDAPREPVQKGQSNLFIGCLYALTTAALLATQAPLSFLAAKQLSVAVFVCVTELVLLLCVPFMLRTCRSREHFLALRRPRRNGVAFGSTRTGRRQGAIALGVCGALYPCRFFAAYFKRLGCASHSSSGHRSLSSNVSLGRAGEGRQACAASLGPTRCVCVGLAGLRLVKAALDDGRIEIDNNVVERAMRPIAMGLSLCTSFSSVWKHWKRARRLGTTRTPFPSDGRVDGLRMQVA